jgi:hypothetical protein
MYWEPEAMRGAISFRAKITDAPQEVAPGLNKWFYEWEEVVYDGSMWIAKDDGRTHETHGLALNGAEDGHTSNASWGTNLQSPDILSTTFVPYPVGEYDGGRYSVIVPMWLLDVSSPPGGVDALTLPRTPTASTASEAGLSSLESAGSAQRLPFFSLFWTLDGRCNGGGP